MLEKLKFTTENFYSLITSKKFLLTASPLLVISLLLQKYKKNISFDKSL